MHWTAYIPALIGLILVVVGVLAHDSTVRDVGLGFLGAGGVNGAIASAPSSRRVP